MPVWLGIATIIAALLVTHEVRVRRARAKARRLDWADPLEAKRLTCGHGINDDCGCF